LSIPDCRIVGEELPWTSPSRGCSSRSIVRPSPGTISTRPCCTRPAPHRKPANASRGPTVHHSWCDAAMAGGILWLASYPKSGNTWVRIFLENLFRNADRPVSINALGVVGFGDAHVPLYERFAGRPLAELDDATLHALREPIQRQLASRPETSMVKTHNALAAFEGRRLIHLEYTTGAIYIVRNVFDVTVSISRHFGFPVADAVDAVCSPVFRTRTTQSAIFQMLGRWDEHYRSWTSVAGFEPLVLRYEDMRAKPLKSFARVARHLRLPATKDRIARAVHFRSFGEVARLDRAAGIRERARDDQVFFHPGRAGGWREVLTPDQVARLIEVHGDVLRELRYLDHAGRPTV